MLKNVTRKNRLLTNTPIDLLLDGGLEPTIINIYGPAGSGKTNIALCTALSCLKYNKKVLFVDTEGNFSLERFKQLGGKEDDLKNIIFYEPSSWKEQHEKILKLEEIVKRKNIGLIIIDSFVALYRLELDQNNFQRVNRQLATQYSILSKIARENKIPILVTNQVYAAGEKIEMTSRMISKYWSKVLIELKKTLKDNQRVAILRKHRSLPENKSIKFEITKNKLKRCF